MTGFKFFNARDPAQNRYLTEGCCPNGHGPLSYLKESFAVCFVCDTVWKSKRVEVVFPNEKEVA